MDVSAVTEPFVQDSDFTLYQGDALEVLRGLPDESVHCCLTSPPFWPEALAERIIKAGCPHGGTVLDPFLGSGTTALVARRFGRRSIGIELSPDYCALAARRLQQLSLLAEAGG